MREVDVVIVGAGAAGIAAGRELAGHGVGVILLDAAPRIGGRAWTCRLDDFRLDLGCGWLHSADRNPWAELAEAAGFTIDRTPPPWGTQVWGHGFPEDEQAKFAETFATFEERLNNLADGTDLAAAEFIEQNRWAPLANALSSYINGAELDRVSARDLRAYNAVDTGVNWRCAEGYGTLVAHHATGLDIRLDTPVSCIDWAGNGVQVATPRGRLCAEAAIITVSTAMIAGERLRFSPALPGKVEAASRLPLGLANKVTLAVAQPEAFPKDAQLFGRTDTAATGAYHLRPFGRPLIEAFLGGRHADELDAAGEGAATAFAIDELKAQLGSDFAKQLTPLAETRWRATSWIGGAYSYAAPGHADERQRLAEPVAGKLFFAGEACSRSDYSTAHGAYATGVAAARAALAALGTRLPIS